MTIEEIQAELIRAKSIILGKGFDRARGELQIAHDGSFHTIFYAYYPAEVEGINKHQFICTASETAAEALAKLQLRVAELPLIAELRKDKALAAIAEAVELAREADFSDAVIASIQAIAEKMSKNILPRNAS